MHTPSLRYHDLPLREGADRIGPLSLLDYTDDLVALAESLDSPPLIIGLSLGGLVAQLVAVRTPHAGLVAACPSGAAGVRNPLFGPVLRIFGPHFLQRRPWATPVYPPTYQQLRRWIANEQTEVAARELFDGLVCESGRVYCEMAAPQLDRARATRVDFAAVTGPVLTIGGQHDLLIPTRVARETAAKYRNGTYVEIPGSDHLVFFGDALSVTMREIDTWMAEHRVLAATS